MTISSPSNQIQHSVDTFPIFQILAHKIYIKEWESEKENILSLVPFDSSAPRTVEDDIEYTDFFEKKEKEYEHAFLSLVKPYLDSFLEESEYKFSRVTEMWCQKYLSGDYHAPHDHGPQGYACVFYAKLDDKVHPGTMFFSPFQGVDGGHSVQSFAVTEGDLVIFPCSLMHMAPPHHSEKDRIIIAFNLL